MIGVSKEDEEDEEAIVVNLRKGEITEGVSDY
jgi:hypothetical protein